MWSSIQILGEAAFLVNEYTSKADIVSKLPILIKEQSSWILVATRNKMIPASIRNCETCQIKILLQMILWIFSTTDTDK